MEQVEVFPRAPIEEAILAFEVPRLDDLTLSAVAFHEAIRSAFPMRREIDQTDTLFTYPPQRRLGPTGEPKGLRFSSEDGLQVVEVTRTGLSFHRLRPYISWEHFEASARPVWKAFLGYFGPEGVSSLRLRYLNRIDLPGPVVELGDYLYTYPEIASGIEREVFDYLIRLRMLDQTIPARGTVTQRTDYKGEPTVLPLVFDVDVATMGAVERSDEAIWARINQLRDFKNRLFFSSITSRTRELFR
jgi:uncharacterized protein (TIGR04255 family)